MEKNTNLENVTEEVVDRHKFALIGTRCLASGKVVFHHFREELFGFDE